MGVKVVKFGGSSLASAEQFVKVGNIIKADSDRRYVVPSAPGKRFSDDIKVTDMLYRCYELAKSGKDISEVFSKIEERYNGIISELGITLDLTTEFERIKNGIMNHAGRDFTASRGEYLNGMILAKYLGYEFIDAQDVIFFEENGKFDSVLTNNVLSKRLSKVSHAVIPGFYGAMPNGTIKTFSRGGSDVTGSIVALAANADLYENWTDVSGFLVADPRIVKDPKGIKCITYAELRELSYMGASVLHEDAIFPVRKAKIPINIKNTNAPEDMGTMIVSEAEDDANEYIITGISGKKGFSVINIEKDTMNSEIGFLRRVLTVLENNKISFEHIPSGIDTMSIVVHTSEIEGKQESVCEQIRDITEADTVTIDDGIALIAVVGRGMRSKHGTAARVFAALSHARINIKMIDQGSSELNIIVGVNTEDFEAATKAIYDVFVMSVD
ncbi:MAG: aspartate kinase [Oscillospiraceae bacterium]